jgi:hypothetical protein
MLGALNYYPSFCHPLHTIIQPVFTEIPQPNTDLTRVRRHHHLNPDNVDELTFILYAADNLTKMNGNGISGGSGLYELDEQVMQFLALEEEDIINILSEANDSVNQMSGEIFGTA